MSKFSFVINLDRCSGCQSCEIACKYENNIPLGEYWSHVLRVGPTGTFPKVQMYWLPAQCQQCENAPCVHVCPTGASYRDPKTNLVLINKEACIGCKYCMMACPYGVRSWNEKEKVVEKCTTCGHLEEPPCVTNCTGACRFFGDLDDPSSAASKALAAASPDSIHQLRDVGNKPTTYYILSPKYAEWKEEL
ncbi:MAG: 4Fe-4S dicluster domain-containing protein [Eggerthellaceae bacterium]|nr:4Fe-4S dicluster domain-containing protein [Eggerthellaceae bacterium]